MPENASYFLPRDSCALCGRVAFQERARLEYAPEDQRGFFSSQAASEASALAFVLRRCQECGFQWTSPQPTTAALSQLYSATGSEYFTPLAEASSDRRRVYQAVKEQLRDQGVRGRLLDLGCGTGEALSEFQGGFELFGVEPSPFAAARAVERSGAKVHVGDLKSAAFPERYFDAITAFDVVEHLAEPVATLHELHRILRPGGMLFLETGDIESINARIAAGHWYYVLLPGHLSFFSHRTLPSALAAAGFVDVSLERTHHGPVDVAFLAGFARAYSRHLLIRVFGERVLSLPLFRSRNTRYRIPFFYDHMLVAARAR
jgi:SAM-dependent methyltransferase